ncbi:hypothetical protein [Ureibacillus sp. GCM10028918]|uniref:hypothetical protein n=1 Tax=Ureibacillus sp. GCM10028918 TaxID=3273429 RepID=UPI0036234163
MKKWSKRFRYTIGGIVIVFLLVVLAFKIHKYLNEKEQQEAIKQTQHYLAENYQNMKYDIQDISSSTDFKHYGYFEHAVTVQDINTKETFEVFYDKKMNRMEDSHIIETQEELLKRNITPKIEKYIEENFGETRYIYVSYDIASGKPMIVVKFNQNHEEITQKDFDTFISYLKETIGIDHAIVIVDYWKRELSFNKEF